MNLRIYPSMSCRTAPQSVSDIVDVSTFADADEAATAAIIDQGRSAIRKRCMMMFAHARAVANTVEKALAVIQPTGSHSKAAEATPDSKDAAFALEIEAFSCCLRGQLGYISTVRKFIETLSIVRQNIEPWTGYSTILSVLAKLFRKAWSLKKIFELFEALSISPFSPGYKTRQQCAVRSHHALK